MQRTVFRSDDEDVNFYRLLTAVVVPRPIAWVSSLSADGVVNLAPHSFYSVACARPPILLFTSVGSKDTLRNVKETGRVRGQPRHGAAARRGERLLGRLRPRASEPMHSCIAMEPSGGPAAAGGGSPVSLECPLHSTTSSVTPRSCSATSS